MVKMEIKNRDIEDIRFVLFINSSFGINMTKENKAPKPTQPSKIKIIFFFPLFITMKYKY